MVGMGPTSLIFLKSTTLLLTIITFTSCHVDALSIRSSSASSPPSVSRSEAIRQMTSLFAPASLLSATIPLLLKPNAAHAMYENSPNRPDSGPVKLPSGVTYEDLRPGTGDVVSEGKRVNIQWVLKRSNGYYVDSSERNDGVPFIFTVGDPKGAIAGLNEGIQGMSVGGIRRIIIPPGLSYVEGVEDDKPGPVPEGFGPKQRMRRVMTLLKDVPGESILLDVKATRVQ
mmetsp:Transcript_22848/g.40980  ORF Transcript_22848/g.40980 Transcript_22848/m.40980 type:complete len:228 (+) Transcript_22848:64-747(+)